MAIDINKLKTATSTPLQPANTARQTRQNSSATAQTAAKPLQGDSVNITAQAQELQSAQTNMAALPEIDQAKVAEIKQAITEGRYKIDAEKLAANMISFESELEGLSANKE